MTVTEIFGQKVEKEQATAQLDFFRKSVDIPLGYNMKHIQLVDVDKLKAYWFRYEKTGNEGLGKEHFSFLVTERKPFKILGFTHMDAVYSGIELLSKEKANTIAVDFLKKVAPELNEELTNLYTERHDEEIVVDGKKQIVSGMKYKCYRKSNDDYAWVIVANNGSVVTFERDILWANAFQSRITNKWLHDSWLVGKNILKGLRP